MAGKHVRRRHGLRSLKHRAGLTVAALAVAATGTAVPLALTSGTPAGAYPYWHCELWVPIGNALHPSQICIRWEEPA